MQCLNHPEVDQDIVRCLRCQQPYCPDCLVLLRGYWYCGPCKNEVVRDIQSGTLASGDLATVGQRFLAALLDGIIQSGMIMIVVLPIILLMGGFAAFAANMGPKNSDAAGAALGVGFLLMYGGMFVLSIAVPICYEALFLSRKGQTPGKMILSIRVVDASGAPVSRGQAWGRAAIKTGLAQACSCVGFLADDLPAFFTDERTALHDMAATTRVVRAL